MSELILILDQNKEIQFMKIFGDFTEKEKCTLILLSYASVDLLDDYKFLSNSFFYKNDSKYFDYMRYVFIFLFFIFLFLFAR